MFTIHEQLDRIRRGGAVKRYHTHPVLQPNTDASHSWFVAVAVAEIYKRGHRQNPPTSALLLALFHDVGEYDVGDTPAWVKHAHPDLKRQLHGIEKDALRRLDLEYESRCDAHDCTLVGQVDQLCHLYLCLDERRFGNQNLDVPFHRGVIQLRHELVRSEACRMCAVPLGSSVDSLDSEFADLCGRQRFNRVREDVIAGRDYFSRLAKEMKCSAK